MISFNRHEASFSKIGGQTDKHKKIPKNKIYILKNGITKKKTYSVHKGITLSLNNTISLANMGYKLNNYFFFRLQTVRNRK